ncbi:hypothetical protein Ac2012v2_003410 [Leucoagaricus gongylophorus]
MPRPVLRAVLRSRPPKPYLRYLRFRSKPFPQNDQVFWGFAAFKFLRHTANLRPDAYVCLKDLEDAASVPHKDSQKIIDWVRNDHLQRFQLTSELGRVEGKPGLHPSWFIRAKKGHTIPGVDISTTLLTHPKQLSSLVYATTPENWLLITKNSGILPSTPNLHTPQNRNPRFTYFAQDLATLIPQFLTSYPAENNTPDGQCLVQLHIGINVKQAMDLGIKFFRNKYDQISSTGLLTGVDDQELGKIPIAVFNNVFVAVVEREMKFQRGKTNQEGGNGAEAKS